MKRTTQHRMPHSQQGEGHKMVMVGGELIMEIIIKMNPKKSLRIETLMATQPKSMRAGRMKKEKGPEAQVLEGKDTAEGTEV